MENKYYLAVEIKPKNYFPINLLDLNVKNSITTNKLEELDKFTLEYTKEEIMNLIKDANVAELEYDTPLIIIYYEKNDVRKIPVLTKDLKFDIWDYLRENYQNKLVLNKIDNFLKNRLDEKTFNEIKSSKNIDEYLINISNIPYEEVRKLYFYLYEN